MNLIKLFSLFFITHTGGTPPHPQIPLFWHTISTPRASMCNSYTPWIFTNVIAKKLTGFLVIVHISSNSHLSFVVVFFWRFRRLLMLKTHSHCEICDCDFFYFYWAVHGLLMLSKQHTVNTCIAQVIPFWRGNIFPMFQLFFLEENQFLVSWTYIF